MLSAELQQRYRAEVDVDWRHVYVFAHPRAETIYAVNHTESVYATDPFGTAWREFAPIPVEMSFPKRDDSGTYEFSLTVCGVGLEGKTFIDAAYQDPTQPIKCYWSVIILGDTTPQIDPWIELDLANVTLSLEGLVATATRTDILNRPFPKNVYRLSKFPGLRRQ